MVVKLLIVVLIGLGLRLWGLDKPEGLWNDEYVSWFISGQSFSDLIVSLKAQCHMPFYYLYLKMMTAIGGNGDYFLRLTSVIPGVLAIPVMYLVGARKNKNVGFVAALVTALSSFLIYYSQEARLYSLLFLLSALALFYLLKFLQEKNFTNILGLIIFDFMIMFTHAIGFVFVFFQLVVLSILILKEYKKQLIILWSTLFGLFVLSVPLLQSIFFKQTFSQWWGAFSFSKIGFLFTDYFSPVLTNLVNAPDKFIYVNSVSFVFFTIIPATIALFLILKSIYKDKENSLLILNCIGYVLVLAVAAVVGKLVFITKYSIEIYPVLIYLLACGVNLFSRRWIGNSLLAVICLINLTYIVTSPVSAPKMPRPQGHKIVTDLIERAELKPQDIILFEYYPENRFEKYKDFSEYRTVTINKGNFPDYLSKDVDYAQAYAMGKVLYNEVFERNSFGYIEYCLQTRILDKLEKGQSVAVIVAKPVAIYSPADFDVILSNQNIYEKIPLMYLIFSYVNNHVMNYFNKNLTVTRYEVAGDWALVKFSKLGR